MSTAALGWTQLTFGELFDRLQYGLTAKASKSSAGVPFLRITDIAEDGIDWQTVPKSLSGKITLDCIAFAA
ncbi:hypothetical protein HAP41_0000046785 [Bradyrhizobium barranii subsp. apii]|uniref:Uncharacterized protein n=1 Tax=Bradyrhizobium barranii subsp. apii TaxID=2819348 RepID=A0A8T5UWG4_9BRAD|nr:hypothetical protein [Bradyrhizobium barranii]UPT87538.1 hypothetical protein HAP41_0000046785 [Bradyrhizobium barranii subsp. apii]